MFCLLPRRHFDGDGLAAPFFRHQAELGELALDPLRLRVRLVDLVDRHDDRHVCRLGVVDRFLGLRHHAVVGRDHQHDDVGDLRAAGAHQRERRVARRVEEHDVPLVDGDVIRADVLRDPAGFALGDACFADRVEQAGLAVVDVAHHRDDRRAQHDVFRSRFAFVHLQQLLLEAPHLHVGAELARDHRRGLGVERRVDGQHQPLHQQLGEDVLDAEVELVREILDRHPFGERDRLGDRRRRRSASAAAPDARVRGAAPRRAGRCRPAAADTTAADGIPGRCGYGWPGRGGMPGCCVRIGCDGSGRGPPIGGRELGYCGRCPGAPGRGRRDAPAGWRRRPCSCCAGCAAPAGRAAIGAAGFGGAIGRCTARGGGVVGSGCVGVVGRCCSMRSRSVGGTMRPAGGFGADAAGAAATGAAGCAGAGVSVAAGGGAAACSTGADGGSTTAGGASSAGASTFAVAAGAGCGSATGGASTGVAIGAGASVPLRPARLRSPAASTGSAPRRRRGGDRLDRLDQARRRQRGRRRLRRFRRFLRGRALLALRDRCFGEHVARSAARCCAGARAARRTGARRLLRSCSRRSSPRCRDRA